MDRIHYEEMEKNLNGLVQEGVLSQKKIYLFGHCNATEELVRLLEDKGFKVEAILDNNAVKQGKTYCGIMVRSPQAVLAELPEQSIVCIVARSYAAMSDQLKRLGYTGLVRKLADYNSFAEYSLSEETIALKQKRAEEGMGLLEVLERHYPQSYKILCPFSALGDIYDTM